MTYAQALLTRLLLLSTTMLSVPILADDTEIFLGRDSNTGTVKPNVLFVLDNSGSMDGVAYDENGNRSALSRMETMKLAFEEVLASASQLNVGIMSFNGNGGSILYPVRDIDELLTAGTSSVSETTITQGNDDGVEMTSSGNVYLDDETLHIGHTANREIGRTVRAFLQDDYDDIEGRNSIAFSAGQAQFNMHVDHLNGLRYYDLGIPIGATITNAYLEFTSSTTVASQYIKLGVYGQLGEATGRFADGEDLSQRLSNATTAIEWTMAGTAADTWYQNQVYQSPDISPVIQAIIDQDHWRANNPIVIMVDGLEDAGGGGHRAGYLHRSEAPETTGADGRATKLVVTYTTNANATVDQLVGLRFDEIEVPAGATITSARIELVSARSNGAADNLAIQVQAENTGDAASFTDQSASLSSRSKFSDVTTWKPDEAWDYDQTVSGPNVTALVQRIVNDADDWCGGNAMAFYLKPASASDIFERLGFAYEAGIGRRARLSISYTGGDGGCIQKSVARRISASENDADQYDARNSRADNNNNSLRLNSNYLTGLRFEDLPIAYGQTVVSAHLEITSSANDSGTMTITIAGDDKANAGAFPQNRREISDRDRTSAQVDWTVDAWQSNITYTSPDISAVINEVLSDSDWESGQALALILSAQGIGERYGWAYDGSSGKSARLVLRLANDPRTATNPATVRWHEIELVNALDARGLTPVAGALYEGARYFRGESPVYGANRAGSRWGRVSHELSYSGGTNTRASNCNDDDLDSSACASEYISGTPKYISPITNACQTSHMVLLTDGVANNNDAQSRIAALIGNNNCSNDASYSGERCVRSLTKYLANNDLAPQFPDSNNTVNTHTVAFNLGSSSAVDFLKDLAAEGNGGFYTANSSQQLVTAFDDIIRNIRSTSATFVAPGATINQFNRLSHRSEVYFSVFKPDANPRWDGNLKRYKLLGNPAVISDVSGKAAVDAVTGYFKETAQSVWSPTIDGAQVAKGGAASQRPASASELNTYTYVGSKDLTTDANAVHEDNVLLSAAMLDSTPAERARLLRWARGVDELDWDNDSDTSETRRQYADPLHSVPRIITYGGTAQSPDTAIYFGTNGGYLHAIDGETGRELFSFMPPAMLEQLPTRFENTARFTHPYGVDGSPVSFVDDSNGDGQINASDGDRAYLYFGLRRGGRDYFALDVTDRASPRMLWHIEGGTGDFEQLGQSWSTPVIAQINYQGTPRQVLIFGAGYDPQYDQSSFADSTVLGSALYIVDAFTGERLWYATSATLNGDGQRLSGLQYPLAADVTAIDIDGDNSIDQIYAADLFGQILRFDVNVSGQGSNWLSGGVIARLGSSALPNNRRFFNAPDLSLTSTNGKQKLAIAIGSGSRPTPLSRISQDRFFVLFQDAVFKAPATYATILTSDLLNQTSSAQPLTSEYKGWYLDLPNSGEKVLSSSVTLNNKIVFTTYTPESAAGNCQPVVGTGRSYVLQLVSSKAVADLDNDGTLEEVADRSRTLASGNIPPSPKVLFPEDSEPTILIGPEQPLQDVDFGLVDNWTQIYRRPEEPK